MARVYYSKHCLYLPIFSLKLPESLLFIGILLDTSIVVVLRTLTSLDDFNDSDTFSFSPSLIKRKRGRRKPLREKIITKGILREQS